MGTANSCNVPEELYFWVREHVWVRPEDDGTVTIGMTDAAQHLAGMVVNAAPKPVGKTVKKGKSSGTVESGKWVGPVKSPVDGEVVASNDKLRTQQNLLNEDPYGEGWFVRIKPSDWDTDRADLVTGEAAVAAYKAFLDEEGISCG
ncbi:MAG: glycine cleavage system protein GcvH [Anaerolineae bacterium]|nr:glycine cleavage system protein GcvH [Anaerolineae bacterium]